MAGRAGRAACLLVLGALAATATASPAPATWRRAPAGTLRVNTTRDELRPGDGRCSLREAVAAVNSPGTRTDCGTAGRRSNTIVLGAGRYVLAIRPAPRDDNTSGDLNLTGRAPLTIAGLGPSATIIDAGGLGDRVLSIAQGARLRLVALRITGGRAPGGQDGRERGTCAGALGGDAGDGGGIYNAGRLSLDTVIVTGNAAGAGGAGGNAGASGCAGGSGGHGGSGGGIYNRGNLTIDDSTLRHNSAGAGGAGGYGDGASGQGGLGGAGGSGGGIYNRGRLVVNTSTIDDNRAGAGGPGGTAMGALAPGGRGALGGSGGGIFSARSRLRVVNSTVAHDWTGPGGEAGSPNGSGGDGGNGGGIAAEASVSLVLNATVADNGVAGRGPAGTNGDRAGARGRGGGLFMSSPLPRDRLSLQNTIVADNAGSGCAGTRRGIVNAGHDLSYGDGTCPGRHGNPRLGRLTNNGGPTRTMALQRGSAAINRLPRARSGCPPTDQRGVSRPQGGACDIGAFEFAVPKITILAPYHGASYERGSRIPARFRCGEGGVASTIAKCHATASRGHAIGTNKLGTERFVVTAVDRSGNRTTKTIHYTVWEYVNPLREVSGLTPRRIDLGVDYAGSGPILALGRGRVTMASDTDSGPSSCWAISCWPGGGIVVYRLLDGPFAGKYVYVAEHLTVTVRAGQIVSPGQQIAKLYAGYPWSEFGWAAGPGPEALGMADGHQCPCSDVGNWSTIEGRNFNQLLVNVGAPSGLLQPTPPNQSMPAGWPNWSG